MAHNYPQNHDELSAATQKIQALLRGRNDRKNIRKKRASIVLASESTTTTETKHQHGDWVETWDPHYQCNYYYNMATDETSWDPPSGWKGATPTPDETTNDSGYGKRTAPEPEPVPTEPTEPTEPTPDHIERTASGPTKHNAAVQIQSQARARLARQELAAMKEVERIGHLRRGGLPPEEDFRQAGQKLRGEIKQVSIQSDAVSNVVCNYR